MRCADCKKPLAFHYFLIGGVRLCADCALNLVDDIDLYEVEIFKEGCKEK